MKILIIFFSIAVSSSLCSAYPSGRTVCFKNACLSGRQACVQAEVVDTESRRQLGLMFREDLLENQGMLFIFEEEKEHSFWMKNMRFPLDIIWIDEDKTVAALKTNVQPCKYSCESITPRVKARYVLEVSAGFAEKNKIKIGDRVDFQDRTRENP